MSSGVGFLLAAASAVLNGSFVVFSKLPSVRASGVDPLVFQLWTSLGVFLSSLLTMPFFDGDKYPAAGIGWGVLAGGLFVCAVAFSFVAVQLVGLSIGQGIWSGSAVLVSFIWGVAAFGDEVRPGIAGAGLALIVLGVLGIAGCADIAACFGGPGVEDPAAGEGMHAGDAARPSKILASEDSVRSPYHQLDGSLTPAHGRDRTDGSVDLDPQLLHPAMQKAKLLAQATTPTNADTPLAHPLSDDPDAKQIHAQQAPLGGGADPQLPVDVEWASARPGPRFDAHAVHPSSAPTPLGSTSSHAKLAGQRQLYGSLCALLTGVFGGSILMPLQLAPKSVQGLSFVPSFGLGTLLVAPIITLPYMWLSRSAGSRGNWAVRECLLPGLAAGLVWNGANVCSIYAISFVGYAVAYPLMQCAIAVAALWGVLVFHEIRGRQIGVMAISAVVVLGGAVLLALSKK